MTFLSPCRLTRLYLNRVSFYFDRRSFSSSGRLTLLSTNISFCYKARWNNRNWRSFGLSAPISHAWSLSRKILMTCPIVLQINSAGFEYVQLNISFKDGVLCWFHGRISSFWTSPGRFPRIVAMSKSGVGDVSVRTTPGVALRRGTPRRNYFSSLHLTRWTGHLEPKIYFILALYRMTTSSPVLLKSQRLRGIVFNGFLPLQPPVWTVQPREQSSTWSHIQDTSRLWRLSRTWGFPWNLYWMLLVSYKR